MGTKSKVKARRMWANRYYKEAMLFLHPSKNRALAASGGNDQIGGMPVAMIPLDDMEALIATAAAAHYKAWSGIGKPTNGDCMRAALEAIGVLPNKRKGRK